MKPQTMPVEFPDNAERSVLHHIACYESTMYIFEG